MAYDHSTKSQLHFCLTSVGFTYLAERESASNMFLEPFSPGVWWSCLAIMAVLALVERLTAKTPLEKDGAFYTVLTTWLQQGSFKYKI